jgi:hypothetical protein
MKNIFLSLLFLFLSATSFSQNKGTQLQVRMPFQLEYQEATIQYTWGIDYKKGKQLNFGLDALLHHRINRYALYAGIGYFRNKMNIRRPYDHMALNQGVDSLPIGTLTDDYTYSLLRFPIGVGYTVVTSQKGDLSLMLEHLFNYSLRRDYKGGVPFSGANTTYKKANPFGNSVNLLVHFSIPLHQTQNRIEFEPFVRIYHKYRKDKILMENESESIERRLGAFGIGVRYCFNL